LKVELVAKTAPLVEGVSTAEFAAYVARIGKIKENPEKLMKYLVTHKHWSPFEHTFFTFKIQTSMSIGEQLLRHRSFTFQKQSGRYEEMNEFEPIELRKQAEKNRQSSEEIVDPILKLGSGQKASAVIDAYLRASRNLYEMLLSEGVARECARLVLPACTSTMMLMSGSLRSWFHFLEIRDDGHAQKEAQEIAREIKGVLAKEIPGMFVSIENK
jgi:thymidylate synthase (FAD)